MSDVAETIRTDEGEMSVTVVTPQLLTTVARGVAHHTMILAYFRVFHAFIDAATRTVDVFHDWYDVTAANADARAVYVRWARERREKHRGICRGVHTLVRSPLVYLALEAGSVGFSYAHVYRVRDTFEQARRKASALPSTDPIVR